MKRFGLWGFLLLLVVAVIFTFCDSSDCRFPTDAEIRETWNDRKTAYLSLKDDLSPFDPKILGFNHQGVFYEKSWNAVSAKEAGVSEDSYKRLKKRMKDAGIARMDRHGDSIYLWYKACGFGGSGFRVFFVFETTPPHPTIESLDRFPKKKDTIAYVPLEGNWYVKVAW